MPRILLIDDEKAIRATLREILEHEGYEIGEAQDGKTALQKLKEEAFDLALCDIKMPGMDGMEVLGTAKSSGVDTAFIMISAHGTIEIAVEATKKGAFDFLTKPPDLNRLLITVRNALDRSELEEETKTLRKKVEGSWDIIGESEAINKVKETISKVAPTEARVLITGPNGSGKELVAKALHKNSSRKKKKLIEVNCAAIPSELIESELFGHEKGSFTGAAKQRIGKFEQANGGTLFLDEVGDMSLSAQAKVLRALQEGIINRVGSNKDLSVDVRVFAATNKNISKEIEEGNFREDLYHRLNVIPIHVPSLNDRRDDVPLLVEKFLGDIAENYGEPVKEIEPKALAELKQKNWTGNVRELRNVVERLIIMSGTKISLQDVQEYAFISS